MKKFYFLSISLLTCFFASNAQTQTVILTSPGSSTWTVPCGVTSITVEAWGSGAGGSSGDGGGGGGAYAKKIFTVTGGTVYNLIVGNGAQRGSGDDGEFSRFRLGTVDLVAAEGGGPGTGVTAGGRASNSTGDTKYSGGNGGASSNGNGGSGGGGSAGAGGNGGNGQVNNGNNGGAGGIAGLSGGAEGGDGGSKNGNGGDGLSPGAGGGERGKSGSSSGGGADGKIIITYTGLPSYCQPDFTTSIEPITNVIFGAINNTTSRTINGTPALEIFCISTDVSQGVSYPISVKGNTDGNYINRIRVFIDWNQNGLFDDGSTLLSDLTNSTGIDAQTSIGSIAVPSNAAIGTTTMRVIKNYYNSPTDPCGNYNYGQAEDYQINVLGACKQPTSITANGSIGDITICAGTAVSLKQVGGTISAAAQWKWYTGSCGGTLVNTNSNADGNFTVTPLTTTTYFLRAEGGSCGSSGCISVKITVSQPGTITLNTGAYNFPACKGDVNKVYVQFTIGGGATGATASNLPAGLSLIKSGNQYSITGTVIVTTGSYPYKITLTGGSPCTNPEINGIVTVSETPSTIKYTTPVIYCKGATITPNLPTLTGGLPTSYVLQGGATLPAGLSLNAATGAITGMPTSTSAATNYTIRASNSCGFIDAVVNITVSTGDPVFSITPSGIYNVCSDFSGINIGLSSSTFGVFYQLYLNGTPVNTPVLGLGLGLPVSFGNQVLAGTYTVRTLSSCTTNMNGSVVINITQKPTSTILYATPLNCNAGQLSPTFQNGPVLSGTFSSTPGLSINASTGVIDLGSSTSGAYDITFTANVGACGIYTTTTAIKIVAAPALFSVVGGGGYCTTGSADDGVEVGLSGSQLGVTYELLRNGISLSPVQTLQGTGSGLTFGLQTIAGTYTIKATKNESPFCTKTMTGNATVIVNPNLSPIVVTPSSSNICQGQILSLTASYIPPGTQQKTLTTSSGNINLAIPDNSTTGVFNVIKVTGIPSGATIKSVVVTFTINHNYAGNLVLNLKGPNGNVLNIANQIGGSQDDFTGTQISTLATNSITTAAPPYNSGIYKPQGGLSVDGALAVTANKSNVTGLSALYGASSSSANGNWVFSARDNTATTTGSITNWKVDITYEELSNPVNVTWGPSQNLFTDPGATIPYAGTSINTIYVKPDSLTTGITNYLATATNSFGCTTTATSVIDVKPSPIFAMRADYCGFKGAIGIIATASIPVNNWLWSDGYGAGRDTTFPAIYSNYIAPKTAGTYYVSARSVANGCVGTGYMSIAQELVTNGDFGLGNTAFTTDYTYVNNATFNGLYPSGGLYTVNDNPNYSHINFWGADHTTADGFGQYMLVNGTSNKVIWRQTVTVLPNTDYYFSAYAVSLNNVGPFANLKFQVHATQIDQPTGALPSKTSDNNSGSWQRFYGNWNSGANTTAKIEIINIENAENGNDFGLDDIAFGTLSTFIYRTSSAATSSQSALCAGEDIQDITYDAGGDGNSPILQFKNSAGTNVPMIPGIQTYWNGRTLRITGKPEIGGDYSYTVTTSGCNPKSASGTLKIIPASKAGSYAAEFSACYNTAGTITMASNTMVGTVIGWQTSTDGQSWNDVSSGLTNGNFNYPGLTTTTFYRVIAQRSTCKSDTSAAIRVGIKNLWVGNNDEDFNKGVNWSDQAVPLVGGSCPTVIIPEIPATNQYPVLTAQNPNITNLQIDANASLIIRDNGVLSIAGFISNSGILDVTEGTLEFNGHDQTISGAILKDNSIKNLIVSNTSTKRLSILSGKADTLSLTGTLSFGTGSTNTQLKTNNNLILKSTALNTANVAQITGAGNYISDSVIVERYLPVHRKAWHMLAPNTKGTSIMAAWQEGAESLAANNLQNPRPGYGININGEMTDWDKKGFDQPKGSLPAMKYWDYTSQKYLGIANTLDLNSFNQKSGYFIFVRGDRSVTLSAQSPKPTTLRSKGLLYQPYLAGALPPVISNLPANQWIIVGNPYASAIDFFALSRTNLQQSYAIWDPNGNNYAVNQFNTGIFRTITKVGTQLVEVPANGNSESAYNIPYIQSGQAFFVQASPTSAGSATFTESAKMSGSSTAPYFAKSGDVLPAQLWVTLYSAKGGRELADGVLSLFSEEFSNDFDVWDAEKMPNTSENMGIASAGKIMAIERSQMPTVNDTIQYNMDDWKIQNYQLAFLPKNFESTGLQPYLNDRYLNKQTLIDLHDTTWVDISIVNIPGSWALNRFYVTFKPTAVLPVKLFTLTATEKKAKIEVEWKVQNEINVKEYQVEKLAEGNSFTKMATVPSSGKGSDNYYWLDEKPDFGWNYYRILSVDKDGKYTISTIAKAYVQSVPGAITVAPNPVVDGKINLHLKNQPAGIYFVRLLNAAGQPMLRKKIDHQEGTNIYTINSDFKIAHAHYQLEITMPGGEVKVITVVY